MAQSERYHPAAPGARLGELPRPLDGRVAIVTDAAVGLANSWTALGKRAAQVREILTEAHDTRGQWAVMTEPTRRMARAADAEPAPNGGLARVLLETLHHSV
jgi:hypothetical protein